MYVQENTKKFENEKLETEAMVQTANSLLNVLRDRLKLCKQKCEKCFYQCLLRKNHEEDALWPDEHSCSQVSVVSKSSKTTSVFQNIDNLWNLGKS